VSVDVRFEVTERWASSRRDVRADQSVAASSQTPTQPALPTYGGTKKRSGAMRISTG
jgi:hypothetical protein